jgi:hypothetical protein
MQIEPRSGMDSSAVYKLGRMKLRNMVLGAALALGFAFATTGAQAAAVSSNIEAVQSLARSGDSVVEKTYYLGIIGVDIIIAIGTGSTAGGEMDDGITIDKL